MITHEEAKRNLLPKEINRDLLHGYIVQQEKVTELLVLYKEFSKVYWCEIPDDYCKMNKIAEKIISLEKELGEMK